MYKILVLHALDPHSRQTNIDHLYCYPQYQAGNLYVFHNINSPVTQELKDFPFDAVILNYCFLAHRAVGHFQQLRHGYRFIKSLAAVRIAVPQDDYTQHLDLDEWLDELGVDIIYSAVSKHLEVLYPASSARATMRNVLTGYSHAAEVAQRQQFSLPFADRPIDIGSRVRALSPSLGRAGVLKGIASKRFSEAAIAAGFATDFSSDRQDIFIGADWYRFLGRCKFTLIARGGASIGDPRGEIHKRVSDFLAHSPEADFDTVRDACFPDVQEYDFSANPPRLFEAAAQRTGLVLLEDEFVEGLKPFEHYLPLKKDFSNIDDVFARMRDEESSVAMIDRAYEFLVGSGNFSYGSFVDQVFADIVRLVPVPKPISGADIAGLEQHFRRSGNMQRLLAIHPPPWPAAGISSEMLSDRGGRVASGPRMNSRLLKGESFGALGLSLASGAEGWPHEPALEVSFIVGSALSAVAEDCRVDMEETLSAQTKRPRDFWREFAAVNSEYVYDPLITASST